MIQDKQEPVQTAVADEIRSAWVQPRVQTLLAGLAEFGDVANPDGNVNS